MMGDSTLLELEKSDFTHSMSKKYRHTMRKMIDISV